MRVARHHVALVQQRLAAQHGDQLPDLIREGGAFLFQVQADVQRDLIVAAAGGVQALSGIAEARGELALDECVDILRIRIDGKLSAVDIASDLLQSGADPVGLILRQDPACAEHRRVGDAALDILPVHPAVKGNRRIKVVCFLVDFFLEASCPKFHVTILQLLLYQERIRGERKRFAPHHSERDPRSPGRALRPAVFRGRPGFPPGRMFFI